MPASFKFPYRTAIPIAKIATANNPGTSFKTVEPQEDSIVRLAVVKVAVFTVSEIGPIKATPIRIAINPLINLAIIFFV